MKYALALAALAGTAGGIANTASANTYTWNGGGANANWITNANWTANSYPGVSMSGSTTNADTAIFDLANIGSAASTPIVLPTSFNIQNIEFTGAAGNYTIGGNTWYATAGGQISILSGLTSTNAVETLNGALDIYGNFSLLNNSANGTGAGAGTLIVGAINNAQPATLTLGGTNTNANTVNGIISGTLALTDTGTGVWELTAANTYTGTTTIYTGAKLQIGNGGSTGSIIDTGSIVDSGSLVFDLNGAIEAGKYSNTISGGGTLTVNGNADMSLSVTNTYTGGTSITAGRVVITASNALGTGTVTISGSGSSGGSIYVNGAVTLGNTFTISGSGGTAVDTTQRGAIRLDSGGTVTGAVTLAAAAGIGTTSMGTFSGIISGNGEALTINPGGDGGIVYLEANNTFSGGLTIDEGTLELGTAGSQGASSGSIVIGSTGENAAMLVNGTSTAANTFYANAISTSGGSGQTQTIGAISYNPTFSGAITLASNLQILSSNNNGSHVSVTGGITGTGNITINSDGTSGSSSITLATGNINNTGTITNSGNDSNGVTFTVISSIIGSNVTGVVQSGANGLTLSGVNTYTGGLTVDVGNVYLYNNQTGATGAINIDSTAGTSQSGQVNIESGASVYASSITMGNTGSSEPGSIELNSSGTVTDAGTLTLARTNSGTGNGVTLTGGTWNQQGALTVDAGGGYGPAQLTVSGGATFTYSSGTAATIDGGDSGGGGYVVVQGNSTFITGTNFTAGGTASNTSVFLTAGGTLQLSGNVSSDLFSGIGSVSLVSGTNEINLASHTASTSAPISGAGSLILAGSSGELTLSGNSTYTGTTTINPGLTLQIGNGTLTTGSISTSGGIVNSGVLLFDTAATAFDYSNVISGSGTLTQSSSGTITLAGINTFSGGLTIASGTVQLGRASAAGSGAITLNSGTTLDYNASATGGAAANGTFGNTFTITGGGTAILGALNYSPTYSGAITLSGGTTLELLGTNGLSSYISITGGITGSGNVDIETNSTATGTFALLSGSAINPTGSITNNGSDSNGAAFTVISAAIGGNVTGVVQNGANGLTLSGANTYTTGLTVDTGTVNLYNNQTGATGAITMANGTINAESTAVLAPSSISINTNNSGAGTFNILSGASVNVSGNIQLGGTGGSYNGETLTSAGTVTDAGTLLMDRGAVITLTAGTWNQTGVLNLGGNLAAANTSDDVTMTVSTGATFVYSNGTSIAIAAGNGGTSSLLIEGGTFKTDVGFNGAIGGASSTNIVGLQSGGILEVTASDATDFFTANVTNGAQPLVHLVAGNGTIQLDNSSTIFTSTTISGAGNLIVAGSGGDLMLTGSNTYTGTTTVNSGATLQIGSGGAFGSITGSGSIVNNGSLIFDVTTGYSYSDPISGSGALTQSGTGVITLDNNDAYTGATTINAGTTLQIGNGSLIVGSITGSGSIVDNGLLLFDTATINYLYASAISGSGAVTQSGSDTVLLTANETYTGATTVNSGSTLQVGNNAAAGNITASGSITANGLLFFDSSTTYTYSNPMSGSGTITFGGTDPIILGDNAFTGTINITGTDTLQLGNGTVSGSFTNAGVINDSGALVFDSNSGTENYNYSMSIAGGGSITQSGTDTITLSASNTVSGQTNANAGTLDLANTNALQDSVLNMNGGAVTFDASVSADVFNIAGLTGASNLSLLNTAGQAINLTLTNASTTYTGILSDGGLGGSLTIAAGTQTLTGNNSYLGTTTIGATAMLILGSGGASGSISTSGSIVDNGTLVFNSSTSGLVYSNPISGAGGITQNGTGYTILEADNSFTGTTTIGGAALQIGNTTAGGITASSSIVDDNALNFQTTDTGANATYSNPISGYGTVTVLANAITLSGNNSYNGATNIDSSATLQVGNGAASGNITASSGISNAGALVFDNSSSTGQTYNNLISGSGSVAVNAGTVTFAAQAENITGAVTVGSGATLALSNTNGYEQNGGLYEAASLTISGTVITDNDNALFGTNSPNVPITINSGGVLTNLGSADSGGGTSVQIAGLITLNGGTLASNGSGTGSTTESMYGSWLLYGGINVTANSTISALQVNANQSGGLQINIATGDVLNVSGSFIDGSSYPSTGIILNPTAGKAGTLMFTGASTYAESTTIDAGTVQIGNGGTSGSITATSTITNNGALVFNLSSNSTYGMVISGSGSVTQSGSGTITLSNTETYTGTTTISSGTLDLTGKLGDTAVTVNGGATLAASAGTSLGATNGTSLTLLSGSTLNLQDGTVGNFTINNSAGSYSGTALSLQGATIDLDLGNSSVDDLVVANGNAVITGTNTINISTAGDSSLTLGTYTILNVENGTKSASPTFQFADDSTKETVKVGSSYYTLSLVDPTGSELLDINTASESIITLNAQSGGTPTGFTAGQQILNHGTPTTSYQGVFSTDTSALTVTGGGGNYAKQSATSINTEGTGNTNSNQGNTTAFIEINGFNPANDEEIVALGIDDNGSLLTSTADSAGLTTTSIVSDINTLWDASGQSGTIAYVLTSSPDYTGVFGTAQYNVYLDFTAGQLANLGLTSSGDNYLGFDFTADPSFNASTADLTVTAVAVVPEPSSLGLMGLGVMGAVASRRRRRKNRKA